MILGVVRCECMLYNAQSLKEKRAVIKSILTKMKQRYNVSASEVDFQDVWQRTEFAVAAVASARVIVEKQLQQALALIDQHTEIERTKTTFEWL